MCRYAKNWQVNCIGSSNTKTTRNENQDHSQRNNHYIVSNHQPESECRPMGPSLQGLLPPCSQDICSAGEGVRPSSQGLPSGSGRRIRVCSPLLRRLLSRLLWQGLLWLPLLPLTDKESEDERSARSLYPVQARAFSFAVYAIALSA